MSFLSEVGRFFVSSSNWTGPQGILARAFAQAMLAGWVILAGSVAGVLFGFTLGRRLKGSFVAVNLTNASRAIPSLALLTLLAIYPPIGLHAGGFWTAFLTLFALALPPILTNSYVGMREVDPDSKEAGTSLGFTAWQRFWKVEVPLALPLAVAGIRTAAVEVVATSTLAAYVTYNDLGEFIFAGLAQNDSVEAFCGAACVAILAGMADLLLLGCYRLVAPAPVRARRAVGSVSRREVIHSRPWSRDVDDVGS